MILEYLADIIDAMDIRNYIEELRTRLHKHRGRYRQIVELSDGELSYSWLSGFGMGRLDNPRAAKLEALDKALADLREQILKDVA